jgi:hypothetical protein
MVLLRRRTSAPRRRVSLVHDFGHRFERSPVGQALISALLILVILIGVVWNLPASAIKQTTTPTLYPIAASTGLQQSWSMYAPNPLVELETLEVHVTMGDGSVRTWLWRKGNRVLGPFEWYRWQKLKEQLVRQPSGRADFSRWVVGELTGSADRPVRVDMVLSRKALPPPGQAASSSGTTETIYSEVLGG